MMAMMHYCKMGMVHCMRERVHYMMAMEICKKKQVYYMMARVDCTTVTEDLHKLLPLYKMTMVSFLAFYTREPVHCRMASCMMKVDCMNFHHKDPNRMGHMILKLD